MSFPAAKTLRRNRRKLGKWQQTAVPPIIGVLTSPTAAVIRITFDRPVNVTGNLAVTIPGRTFVSQSIISPTVIQQTFSGTVTTRTYTWATFDPAISDAFGGRLAGASGTIPAGGHLMIMSQVDASAHLIKFYFDGVTDDYTGTGADFTVVGDGVTKTVDAISFGPEVNEFKLHTTTVLDQDEIVVTWTHPDRLSFVDAQPFSYQGPYTVPDPK